MQRIISLGGKHAIFKRINSSTRAKCIINDKYILWQKESGQYKLGDFLVSEYIHVINDSNNSLLLENSNYSEIAFVGLLRIYTSSLIYWDHWTNVGIIWGMGTLNRIKWYLLQRLTHEIFPFLKYLNTFLVESLNSWNSSYKECLFSSSQLFPLRNFTMWVSSHAESLSTISGFYSVEALR